MATKKPATKKTPTLQEVSRPLSHLGELRDQSMALSNLSAKGWGDHTIHEVFEEITKALAPLRYLKHASIDYSDHFNEFMVNGYLDLFLTHMDAILAEAEIVIRQPTQKEVAA